MTGPAVIAASTDVAATASTTPATRTILERIEASSVWEMPRIRIYREAGLGLHGPRSPAASSAPSSEGAGSATGHVEPPKDADIPPFSSSSRAFQCGAHVNSAGV